MEEPTKAMHRGLTRLNSAIGKALGATAVALACLGAPQAGAHTLVFAPADQTVGLGSQASVAVRIVDALPEGLGAYDFDLTFDAAILSFSHAIDALGLGLAIGLGTTPGAGSVRVSDFSLETVADLLALQPNDFELFTLVFDTLAVGASALGFANVNLGDAAGNPVASQQDTGRIEVVAQAVPAPATALLVGAALLALVGRRRGR
jgi:hypothetical protein